LHFICIRSDWDWENVGGYKLFIHSNSIASSYTMQGDLNLSPLGNPVANSGMMPRVITNLYHRLESTGADFSVKVSFIELYNEELRDLLARDFAEGQEGPSESTTLKIYDDVGKRGIFIQGLEEVLVKDAATAIKLLSDGSHRRQVAATKFNDHSRCDAFVRANTPLISC